MAGKRKGAAILDASTWRPPSRRIVVDGEVRIERYPSGAKRLMVDATGSTKYLKLSTGAAITNPNNEYGNFIMASRMAKGWFPADSCPVALTITGDLNENHLPQEIRHAQPCKRGTYSEKEPCEHLLLVADKRRDKHDAIQRANNERGKTQQQLEMESRATEAETLKEAIKQLANNKAASGKKSRE